MDCDRLPSLSADLLSIFEQAPSVQPEVQAMLLRPARL